MVAKRITRLSPFALKVLDSFKIRAKKYTVNKIMEEYANINRPTFIRRTLHLPVVRLGDILRALDRLVAKEYVTSETFKFVDEDVTLFQITREGVERLKRKK